MDHVHVYRDRRELAVAVHGFRLSLDTPWSELVQLWPLHDVLGSLFGTLKHPSKKVDKLMKQAREGGKSLEELHNMYHTDDIFKAKRK